jgi:RimJ/RimL family protein N-acetyltransferase
MQLIIRPTTSKDIDFYKSCFDNSEFYRNVFGTHCLNINKFVSEEQEHLKYLISVEKNQDIKNFAFAHFYYNSILNHYDLVGGINPKYFNSGMGVYACIVALSQFFVLYPLATVETQTYKYNTRSYKMLVAIGFSKRKETQEKNILELNSELYENDFVKRILMRIENKNWLNF